MSTIKFESGCPEIQKKEKNWDINCITKM